MLRRSISAFTTPRRIPVPVSVLTIRSPCISSDRRGFSKLAAESSQPPFWSKDRIVAKPGFSRWLVPPAAIATHLSIGSVYAWSLFNEPLMRLYGVVAAAPGDWAFTEVVPVFSTTIVALGLSAAIAGSWLERVGPRRVGAIAAALWGSGFFVGALGVASHSLPLLYLGYGVLGGTGVGLGYIMPVSTLLRWFPDRRGLATGLAVMGFGGGAMLGAPLKRALLAYFFKAPEYLGPVDEVPLQLGAGGVRLAERGGELVEVVIATASDLRAAGAHALQEGVYVVGTGDTGVVGTFCVLGGVYFCAMLASALALRVPPPNWRPEGWAPSVSTVPEAVPALLATAHAIVTSPSVVVAGPLSSQRPSLGAGDPDVNLDDAVKTPQFWLLWMNLCCNVSAGIGILGVAKTLLSDVFAAASPDIVTSAFCATYIAALALANCAGRLAWAAASDYTGRQRMFSILLGAGVPLYMSLPVIAAWAVACPGAVAPLASFVGVTLVIISMYGGGFATIPAYLADVFGTKHVGAIHGRLLTAWSVAGVAGPITLSRMRESSVHGALGDLSSVVDPSVFEKAFGAPVSELLALSNAHIVTIPRLLELAPPGTLDPTPFLYDSTMQSCAGMLTLALVSNACIRAVDAKYHARSTVNPGESVK